MYDTDGQPVTSFLAYESTFTGGVRVAVADLNGDGTPDVVTWAGPGGGPRVRAFDGATGATLLDFMAYEDTFTGGVFVAAGPVGGGAVGIATGADATGGPRVRVFSSSGTGLQDFFAFDQTFTGGVRVALGQMGTGPVVFAADGLGMAPTVRGFDATTGTQTVEQAAGDPAETGGVWVAAGDLNADGADDVVTAAGSGPDTELRLFDGVDGSLVTPGTVSGPASGVAILDWGGQPAVGVLSGTALTAYVFDEFADAPTVLGQVDGSGWGGAGASVGGGSRADLSPYPQVVATYQSTITPAMAEGGEDQVRLDETVTRVSDDEYHWQLVYTDTSTPSPGDPVSFYCQGVGLLVVIVNPDDVLRFDDPPPGWTANKGSSDPLLAGTDVWFETAGDPIMPGQSRTFGFYTPVRPVVVDLTAACSPSREVSGEGSAAVPDSTGSKVVITYGDATEVTQDKGLKVAKWQDAFQPTADGKGVEIKGPDANNWDFIDRDPDRFNVWVYDETLWNDMGDLPEDQQHIQVKISTDNDTWWKRMMYNDRPTEVDLVRANAGTAGKGEGWFWSDSQLLVSNKVDDVYSDPAYLAADETGPGALGLLKNGHRWQISDRTHKIALGGTVKAVYTDGANHTVEAKAPVKIAKTVRVTVHDMRDKPKSQNGILAAPRPAIDNYVTRMKEIYAQIGVAVNVQIYEDDPPIGLDLSNGLKYDPENSLSAEVTQLLADADLKTRTPNPPPDRPRIEVYFISNWFILNNGVPTVYPAAWGRSFVRAGNWASKYADSSIIQMGKGEPIPKVLPYMTLAHECGHILENRTGSEDAVHYPYADPLPADASLVDTVNLLVRGDRAEKIAVNDKVTDARRLTVAQQNRMLGPPPQRPNLLS